MQSSLVCFNAACRAQYGIGEVIYNCPKCGGLLEARYDFSKIDSAALKRTWRERRMLNAPLEQSGVWRYRELFPFISDHAQVVTLREGNTPLLQSKRAAEYGGLANVTF
jgi:threonine synthase